jgi:hypothetical protein
MTKVLIIRDASGAVINIGPWDYRPEDSEAGLVDQAGVPIVKAVATNPLPDGAYEDEAEVETMPDGSRRVVA